MNALGPATFVAASVGAWLLGTPLWAVAAAVGLWLLAMAVAGSLRVLSQASAPWPLLAALPLPSLFSWRVAAVVVVALLAWVPLFVSLGGRIPWRMVPLFVLVPLTGVVAILLLPLSLPFVAGDVAARAQVALLAAWVLLLLAATPHLGRIRPRRASD